MIKLIFSGQSRMAQSALKKELSADHPDLNEYNHIVLDMALTSTDELADECESHGLLGGTKSVVAENCAFLAKQEKKGKGKNVITHDRLLAYLNNPDPETDLYLVLYADEPDLKNPLVEAIQKNGAVKEVKQLTESQWLAYIVNYFAKRGKGIDDKAAKELYARTGGDYSAFLNEAMKLLSYKEGELVELTDIEKLVAPKAEDDVWRMSNALCRKDVASALKIYKDLKLHSQDEVALIGLLASQFIFMDKVKYLASQGLNGSAIAKETKSTDGRVMMTLRNLSGVSSESLRKVIESLYETDVAILTGQQEASFAFSLFLANFEL